MHAKKYALMWLIVRYA